MKKLCITVIIATVIFFSCKKEEDKSENLCPEVPASSVPQTVKDSFAVRYPTDVVKTWFNKESAAFCAFFITSGMEKLAQFADNGTFIKEEIETDQQGEYQDSTSIGKSGAGCECEIHEEGD